MGWLRVVIAGVHPARSGSPVRVVQGRGPLRRQEPALLASGAALRVAPDARHVRKNVGLHQLLDAVLTDDPGVQTESSSALSPDSTFGG